MKKAAEILAKILDEKNRQLGANYSSVFGAWSQIVGDSLAEHSRIYEISNGSLFVEVDHPGWMQLLLMKKNRIIRLVKGKYPVLNIKNLRIKVNLRYPAAKDEAVEADSLVQEETADTGQHQELDQILSTVSEDELRLRLKRLFLKSIERESSGRG